MEAACTGFDPQYRHPFLVLAGFDRKSTRLLFTYFWHRLVGSGGIWFCNDWYFYGNGVFRSTFVGILVGPGASVQVNWLYSYINAGVQLVGYYCAAMTVDFRWIGRRRLTVFSFIMVSHNCCGGLLCGPPVSLLSLVPAAKLLGSKLKALGVPVFAFASNPLFSACFVAWVYRA